MGDPSPSTRYSRAGWIVGQSILVPAVRVTLSYPSSWQQRATSWSGSQWSPWPCESPPAARGRYRTSLTSPKPLATLSEGAGLGIRSRTHRHDTLRRSTFEPSW